MEGQTYKRTLRTLFAFACVCLSLLALPVFATRTSARPAGVDFCAIAGRPQQSAVTAGQTNVTWFVLDYVDPLRRPLAELDAAGNPVRYFVWGNGLVAQVETNGTIRYFHPDGQCSTLALTDGAGAVSDQWFYSPYGQVLNTTGATDTPFLWLGGYGVRYEVGGIHLTRYRAYHAGLMRFISPDPIGLAGGVNHFAYANGNPLAFLDFLGLCPDGYYQNPTPDYLKGSPPASRSWSSVAAQTVGEVGLSIVPGGAEWMDAGIAKDRNAPTWQRALAVDSLILSVVTAGTSPNAGAIIRAVNRVDAKREATRLWRAIEPEELADVVSFCCGKPFFLHFLNPSPI